MDYDDEASDPLFLDAMHAIVVLFGVEPDEAHTLGVGPRDADDVRGSTPRFNPA